MADFVTVAQLSAIEPGAGLRIEVAGKEISLWNVDGAIYAIEDICTHEEAYLSEGYVTDNCCVSCPLHGAEFDLKTGKARTLPATEPVATYAVRVVGDDVQVAV